VQHLKEQSNSVDDDDDAKEKCFYWNVMKLLASRFESPITNTGPFQLICDDFGSANMIVNNERDPQIILVHDSECLYTGPKELLWYPLRWLIFEQPNPWSGEMEATLERYNNYFEIYLRMVAKHEKPLWKSTSAKMRDHQVSYDNANKTARCGSILSYGTASTASNS
jgi:hypothetical protein